MPGGFEVSVVGVSFEGRQDILARLYDRQRDGVTIVPSLKRWPDNPYDANAIAVHVTAPGETVQIGYIPKALAATLAPRMDAGEDIRATRVLVICGGDATRVVFGARIDIETPPKEAS
jgi:hypothetical protein